MGEQEGLFRDRTIAYEVVELTSRVSTDKVFEAKRRLEQPQDVDAEASHGVVRARMLVHRRMLTKGKFIDDTKKKRTVVPVRFVRACRSGHIGDIDWYEFVHGGETDCRRQLWIEERGTTGDLSEVWGRCDCGRGERNMLQASEQHIRALGHCDGNRPWLRPYSKEKCGEPNRLLIRTASNAYFSQLMRHRVLSGGRIMATAFSSLSDADLRELAAALKSRRVSAPYSELQVSRVLSPNVAAEVTASLQELERLGFGEQQIATALELLLRDRSDGRKNETPIDLVTSGPEAQGIANRDTAVVVRELFAHAKMSVLVVGYAVYQGTRVFEALAERMEQIAELDVTLFLNIARPDRDTTPSEIIVSRFAQRFRSSQWPKDCRLPAVYYDPRSVAEDKRSSLHAKCVVVDAQQVFVSSANFTKAAQERNIEVGLKIESPWLAQRLIRHFQLLHEHGLAVRVF